MLTLHSLTDCYVSSMWEKNIKLTCFQLVQADIVVREINVAFMASCKM